MRYESLFIPLVILQFLVAGSAIGQSARVVFLKGYVPFSEDVFSHKVRITDSQEGQYARPHTTYTEKYITVGKLKTRSVVVYDYIAPVPAFYIGRDKRHLLTPGSTVQFVEVKNRFSFLTQRYRLITCTTDQFRDLYNHKKWLRNKLLKNGFSSVDELLKL